MSRPSAEAPGEEETGTRRTVAMLCDTSLRMNGWAIAMLILFIWTFPLNLLFLLWRRRTVSGHITVTVWAPGDRTFTEPVPVWTEVQRREVFARIATLQRLVDEGRATAGR